MTIKKLLAEAASVYLAEDPRAKAYDLATFEGIENAVEKSGISLEQLFAAAVSAAGRLAGRMDRPLRDSIKFKMRRPGEVDLRFTERSREVISLSPEGIRDAVIATNSALAMLHDVTAVYEVDVFQALGLRNLSSFVGEIFKKEVNVLHDDLFVPNPNQDGYPDLCARTREGCTYIERHTKDGRLNSDKSLWSPYPYGGVEIKATCGNTPAARLRAKPAIGESRYAILTSAEWKAHHQLTKILLGIYWDFVDGLPTVLAAFYRNDLDDRVGALNVDWGAVVHPRDDGGRTTSVSIMKRDGVRKMGEGWVVLPNIREILDPISRVFSIRAGL